MRAAALGTGIAALAAAAFGPPALLEAWLTAFLLLAGLSVGALGALSIGHLLREDWLDPVRAPLTAAARTLPLVALMALPVLAGVEVLYPWAGPAPPPMPAPRDAWLSPWPFRLRMVLVLALWSGLAWLATRPGAVDKRVAALVLALLVPSVTLAAQDLSLSRDPTWWGSLQGIAAWVEGMTAALAGAALVALLRGDMPDGETGAGEALERALLALGLAAIWLWFTQFIVVWMADLPGEAGWYLRRMEGGWGWLKLGVAVPALLLALVLAAPPRHRPWRMGAVCVLLLASHLAHLWWVVRPDAPVARPPPWLDAAVLAALGLAWLMAWRAGMRITPVDRAAPVPDHVPRPARASAR
ncbi:hypothetical protein [Falsiroseomonas sp. CW058]|uniref:hypothetical protein n=1 Tax=Falsiroseomonas sp. CW058 TaxID=3388664 RepID=UPI003D314AF7